MAQYRGQGHNNRERAEAQAKLQRVVWHGKAKNFHFDNFLSIFKGALNDLETYGDVRTDTGKVQLLLEKTAGDPRLAAARTFIQGDPNMINDFEAAVTYITTVHHATNVDNLI